uniref:AlNc14C11G1373 protein n=1 Tax=Albugo laibachii Nc14 TaxID=890382 RepID=F0W2Z4_9STRA|nr:AlNc14C11G1373 [Albugo laibachii Nc14]|eukprot:CCA15431.1 AlNc14C11G1373 [Albugo laibachii Nc14]
MLASVPTYRRASLEYESIADNNESACPSRVSWKNRLVDYCVELVWKDDSDELRGSGPNQTSTSDEQSKGLLHVRKAALASSSLPDDDKIEPIPIRPELDDETVFDSNQRKSSIHNLDNPSVLHRYPQEDHADFAFPDGISYVSCYVLSLCDMSV